MTGAAGRRRAAVLIGSVLAAGLLLGGCNARTPTSSTGGSPAASTAGSPAATAADPFGDIESAVDAIERDLDADAG